MKTKQKGFTLIETLVIVLVVALLAAGGWYVWHRNHKTVSQTTPSAYSTLAQPKTTTTKPKPKSVDPYANWKTISNPNGAWVSIKIPKTWVSIICDGGTYIGLGKDKNSAGICNSDAIAEVGLTYAKANLYQPPSKATNDKSFTEESFTANGVDGYKYTEVIKNQASVMDAGFTFITYSFPSNGKVYSATYVINENGSLDTATVEKIIQTWKF